ncbi:MAG: elongation factor G [Candidatus Magnetoovum sp. WYHC-5]|nr:elongation factor G [Candidatus Magnetoovum sp. WYHC-5]
MAGLEVEKLRNIALIGHSGAGKTTLAEAILYNCGAITRMGNVEDGNTVMDFDPEEIDRKITITSSVAFCETGGYSLNIIDTPGFINFMEDARGCLRVADGAIVIVSALAGVKAETEKLWGYTLEYGLPQIILINEMDKENSNFFFAVEQVERSFNVKAVSLNTPIGSGEELTGIVDIVNMKAYKTLGDGKYMAIDIPADVADQVEDCRRKLVESVAEADDTLIEKYLEGEELTQEEIIKGIRDCTISRKFVPVVCGVASDNFGVKQLIDSIILCLPSPVDSAAVKPIKGKNPANGSEIMLKPSINEKTSAYVFKTIADPYAGRLTLFRVYSGSIKPDSTIYNASLGVKERVGQIFHLVGKKQVPVGTIGPGEIGVVAKLKETATGNTISSDTVPVVFDAVKFTEPIISYAIEPKSKGDEDKVSNGLQRILEEDPMLNYHRDEETGEMIISGMGQVHIEVAVGKLKRKFGVDVEMKTPKIPYRETIKKAVKAQGKYKKQSGGRGQYGDCWIEIEPLPRGGGFEFVDKIVGGAVPRQYIPAVEKGIVEKMKSGILAGYPVVDIKAIIFDGSYHAVDSSEMAFKIAGSMAIKKAALSAHPVLLEPIMKVEVVIPEEFLGAVIGDLNSKRGKVQGMDTQGISNQKIIALVPMAEMLTYANQLQSITSGRGIYTMEFAHYEEVPAHSAQKIIEERARKDEED